MAINSITLMGRLTANPELKSTAGGKSVCSFTLAVDRFGGKEADFIPCTAWEKTAEFVCRYFEKGKLLAGTGSLQSRKYTDKDGNNRTAYDVVLRDVTFCGDRSAAAEAPQQKPQYTENYQQGEFPDSNFFDDQFDDDIPF